jgi:hypothetical protein
MTMVLDPADAQGFDVVLARDAAEVRPKPLAKVWREEGLAVFGAEDAVGVGADVGHGWIQPSLRDWRNRKRDPAVNCRAIVESPSGRRKAPHCKCPKSSGRRDGRPAWAGQSLTGTLLRFRRGFARR